MSTRTGRTASTGIGVVALLVGLLWIGQGLGYLPGSFMTGAAEWFWIGLVVAVVGVVLLVRGRRRPPAR
jgi:hypothetical protein